MCLGEDKSLEGTETHFLFSTWHVKKRVEKLTNARKNTLTTYKMFK